MKKEKVTKIIKQNRGITLIALIITIIVLLILAGVTIAAINSSESAPQKAVEARTKNEQGAEFDAIKVAAVSSVAEGNLDLYVDVPTLRNGLTGLIQENPADVITTNAAEWVVTGNSGVQYRITNLGNVTIESGISISPTVLKVAKTNESNQTTSITATISKDMEYSTVSWDSSDKSIATVSGTGATATVSILSKGTTTISASIPSVPNPAECTLKIVDTMDKATVNEISVDVGETKAITITNANEIEDIETCSVANVKPEGGTEIQVASVAKNSTTGVWEIKGVAVPVNEDSVQTSLTMTGKTGETKEVSVTVKRPNPPKVGDFVDYQAGNWTREDMKLLGVTFIKENGVETDTIASNGSRYSGMSNPSSHGKFGGFGLGSSKDGSGWRILELDETNTYVTKIINADIPEKYYHYSDQSSSVNILRTTRDWSMYATGTYGVSAACVTKVQIQAIAQNNNLRNISKWYILPEADGDFNMRAIAPDGRLDSFRAYYVGVRPVVTLDYGVTVTGTGSSHDTYESRWTLTKNE